MTVKKYGLPPNPRRLLPFLIICALVTACTPSPPPAPEHIPLGDFTYADDYLDWLMRREMREAGIPGCAVTIVSRDRVIVRKAYGVIEKNTKDPVTDDTVFRAGSLTKSITALAVMRLSERGLVDLDAPLTDYLPEFAMKSRFPATRPITPRLLLSHQAGLPADYLAGIMGDQRLSPRELIQALNREYLSAPPGQRFMYSNTGYGLLGAMIERVTGRRYEEYVQREILDPLGLTHSSLELTPTQASKLASGHMPHALGFMPGSGKDTQPVPYYPIRDGAAGALLTDIQDLGTYVQFLMNDKEKNGKGIISNASFAEMVRPEPAPERVFLPVDYGLGLMSGTFRYEGADDIIHHSGNVNGFYSMMLFSPSRGLGMALLTNSSAGFFPSYRICSLAFRRYLAAATGEASRPLLPVEEKQTPVSPTDLDECSGHYALMGLVVDVTRAGGELRLAIPAAGLEMALVPLGNDLFRPEMRVLGLVPIDISSWIGFERTRVRFLLHGDGSGLMELEGLAGTALVTASLVKTSKPVTTPAAERYLGLYRIERLERDRPALDLYLPMKMIRLENKDGWIMLTSPELGQGMGMALSFVNDREAVLLGTNETVFFEEGTLQATGLKARREEGP